LKPYYKTSSCALYQCDNLDLMKSLPDNYIDLIYCDILYGTGRSFKDYKDLKADKEIIANHYIPRIIEMRRLLKDTGSIYLQMDTRINHWLRIICDDIFGYNNFKNELSWCYRSAGFKKDSYSPKHDVILFYTKSNTHTFNLNDVRETTITSSMQKTWGKQIEKYGGYYAKAGNGKEYFRSAYSPPLDWFELGILPPHDKERLNYDTQKPKHVLEKVIKASSNKNDIIADFYMGSGTTGEVTLDLDRRFIGCDIGDRACKISQERLEKLHNDRSLL